MSTSQKRTRALNRADSRVAVEREGEREEQEEKEEEGEEPQNKQNTDQDPTSVFSLSARGQDLLGLSSSGTYPAAGQGQSVLPRRRRAGHFRLLGGKTAEKKKKSCWQFWKSSPGPGGENLGGLGPARGADPTRSGRGRSQIASRSSVSTRRTGGRMRRFKLDLIDPFHSVINWPWWRVILLVSAVYVAAWMGFGLLYWSCMGHAGSAGQSCISGATDFGEQRDSLWSAFFFSVESMTTIGYGDMVPASPFANVLFTLQSLVGVFVDAATIGLVYAKFARATARAASIIFSSSCIIGTRDGVPCLYFRVANIRKHQLIESHASLFLCYPQKTQEGETSFRYDRLEIEEIGPFLSSAPTNVIHIIDKTSPFYGNDRVLETAELVVLLEGIDSTTSDTTQARHSYVQQEVVYNARFADMLVFDARTGTTTVDMNQFDRTLPVALAANGTRNFSRDDNDDDYDDDFVGESDLTDNDLHCDSSSPLINS